MFIIRRMPVKITDSERLSGKKTIMDITRVTPISFSTLSEQAQKEEAAAPFDAAVDILLNVLPKKRLMSTASFLIINTVLRIY